MSCETSSKLSFPNGARRGELFRDETDLTVFDTFSDPSDSEEFDQIACESMMHATPPEQNQQQEGIRKEKPSLDG